MGFDAVPGAVMTAGQLATSGPSRKGTKASPKDERSLRDDSESTSRSKSRRARKGGKATDGSLSIPGSELSDEHPPPTDQMAQSPVS